MRFFSTKLNYVCALYFLVSPVYEEYNTFGNSQNRPPFFCLMFALSASDNRKIDFRHAIRTQSSDPIH